MLHNLNNAVKEIEKVNVSVIGALTFFLIMPSVEIREVA